VSVLLVPATAEEEALLGHEKHQRQRMPRYDITHSFSFPLIFRHVSHHKTNRLCLLPSAIYRPARRAVSLLAPKIPCLLHLQLFACLCLCFSPDLRCVLCFISLKCIFIVFHLFFFLGYHTPSHFLPDIPK